MYHLKMNPNQHKSKDYDKFQDLYNQIKGIYKQAEAFKKQFIDEFNKIIFPHSILFLLVILNYQIY